MENFKTPFIVKILDKILPSFLGKETNYDIVRNILILKLTLDSRRTSALSKAQAANKKSEPKNIMIVNFIMYGLLGFFAAAMQVLDNMFVANTISYGMVVFVLFSVYISEYSEILLDTREKPFYKVLPIRDKDLAVAKNIHISLYIGGIATVMLLPSVVVGGLKHGFLYSLVFLMIGIWIALFCLSLAAGLYFLLLKMFSGEKLKDMLNYFQVIMTIGLILGYQIIPRIINYNEIGKMDPTGNPFLFVIPSAWFSAVFAILFDGQRNWFYLSLFLVGMVMLTGLMLLNKYLIMPSFEKELSKLEQTTTENKALPWRKRIFCKLLSKSEPERAFMELVSIHLSRDRNLKLKLYPQLANAVILPVIILIPIVMSYFNINRTETVTLFAVLQKMPLYLSMYLVIMISPGIYYIVCQTDSESTTWIYRVLPFGNLTELIKAGIKIVLGQYLTPIFLTLSVVFLVIYQGKILADMVVIYLAFLLFSNIEIRISAWQLPFSIAGQMKNSGLRVLIALLSFLLVGGLGAGHYFLLHSLWLKMVAILVLAALNFLWWRFPMNGEYRMERA